MSVRVFYNINVHYNDYFISGIIPANGETEIAVTFCPIEFHTAYMRVQLVISQFNSNPIVCTFTGTSVPGLLKYASFILYSSYDVQSNLY